MTRVTFDCDGGHNYRNANLEERALLIFLFAFLILHFALVRDRFQRGCVADDKS